MSALVHKVIDGDVLRGALLEFHLAPFGLAWTQAAAAVWKADVRRHLRSRSTFYLFTQCLARQGPPTPHNEGSPRKY